MNEKVIQKILKRCISDCSVHVRVIHDDEFDFTSYFVKVSTRCSFPLRFLHEFFKCMKERYNLDCCDLNFDFDCGFFSFEMF